ncbi:hypothetical protein VTL71DRAFT_10862 [Oculimacula yallundae]|uniref:Uncharacterized protein n=1 Tax=Oculimacula yallundae TaxID=86028 RepID=A0ABR4CVP5_9HELO
MSFSTDLSSTINTGMALSNRLFDIADHDKVPGGGCGGETTQLAIEISLLSSLLSQLSSNFLHNHGSRERIGGFGGSGGRYMIGAVGIVQKILDRCQLIYDELNTMVNRIDIEARHGMKAGKGKEDITVGMGERVRCEVEKNEGKVMRGTLEACTITLHLMMHNLTAASIKRGVGRSNRHSAHAPNSHTTTDNSQLDHLKQTLQLSRRAVITALERLESGDQKPSIQVRSGNRLRKMKPKPKEKEKEKRLSMGMGMRGAMSGFGSGVESGDLGAMEDKEREEKASEWVRGVVRLEVNNELVSIEFSPSERGLEEGERMEYGDGVVEGEVFEKRDMERIATQTGDEERRVAGNMAGDRVGNRDMNGEDYRERMIRIGRAAERRDRESKKEDAEVDVDVNSDENAKGRIGIGVAIGELQGDGPEDLARRSERMEYSRGWPIL